MHDAYFQKRFLWNVLLTNFKNKKIFVIMHDSYVQSRLFWNVLLTNFENMILVIMHGSYFQTRPFWHLLLTCFEKTDIGKYAWRIFSRPILLTIAFSRFWKMVFVIMHDSYFQNRFFRTASSTFWKNDICDYAWFIFSKPILLKFAFNEFWRMIFVIMHDSHFQNRIFWALFEQMFKKSYGCPRVPWGSLLFPLVPIMDPS
jgi:hypothetical protein